MANGKYHNFNWRRAICSECAILDFGKYSICFKMLKVYSVCPRGTLFIVLDGKHAIVYFMFVNCPRGKASNEQCPKVSCPGFVILSSLRGL